MCQVLSFSFNWIQPMILIYLLKIVPTNDIHLRLSFPRHRRFPHDQLSERVGSLGEDGNPQTQSTKSLNVKIC